MPTQLQQIQSEILKRFRPSAVEGKASGALPQPVGMPSSGTSLPQPVGEPTGGGALKQSVFAPPQQQTNGQVLTPTNQAAITRPRNVFAPPLHDIRERQLAEPLTTNTEVPDNPLAMRGTQPNVELTPQINDEPFGTRERRTQPRDYVADDSQYLRDLEAQPRNWKDKGVDALRALNSVWGSNPKAYTPTKREREIGDTEQRLGRELTVNKTQSEITSRDMVPIAVPDGQGGFIQTTVPRNKVASTLQGNERLQQGSDRIAARANKPIYKTDAQGRIVKITPQKDAPDKVETVSKVVKTKVPHTVWADGRLKLWNSETGQFDDAKDTNNKEIDDTIRTPVKVEIAGQTFTVSPNAAAMATATGERFNITEDRAERAETRRDTSDTQDRAAKAAGLVGDITRAREAMAAAKTALAKDSGDTKAQRAFDEARTFGLSKAKELNDGYGDLYKAGEGSEGTPFYEARSSGQQTQSARPKGTWNPRKFAQAYRAKHGHNPTQAEIDAYAAAANQ